MNIEEHQAQWWRVDGNNSLAINYPLAKNSIVVDLGGYHGVWASQIIQKYDPRIVLVEPIPEFYQYLLDKFKNNPKVQVLNYGISTTNHMGDLYISADGTSKYVKTPVRIIVKFITIIELLEKINMDVDLIQINIEGEEYPLLEQMLDDGTILRFSNIQIQYHAFIENAIERRKKIQERMLEHFNKIYDIPFVFEGWALK